MLPTIDIQPLLAFFATVQEAENAVDPGISRLKSPRRGDRSGESSPRSFRNTPRAHTRLTRASDSLSDDKEYQEFEKKLSESNETLQNKAAQQRIDSLLTQLQATQDEQKNERAKSAADLEAQKQICTTLQQLQEQQKKTAKDLQEQQEAKQQLEIENTAFKAKFNFTGKQLAVGLGTTIVATAGITSFVVVKLLR